MKKKKTERKRERESTLVVEKEERRKKKNIKINNNNHHHHHRPKKKFSHRSKKEKDIHTVLRFSSSFSLLFHVKMNANAHVDKERKGKSHHKQQRNTHENKK